jgi:hypothetical protein
MCTNEFPGSAEGNLAARLLDGTNAQQILNPRGHKSNKNEP